MTDETTTECCEETIILPEEPEYDPCVGDEPTTPQIDTQEGDRALAELRPTLMAIPKSELRHLKASAPSAVGLGLAYAKAYADDRHLFDEAFKPASFDVEAHDDLARRAKAFWRADIMMRQEQNREGPVRLLVLEAKPLRTKLMKAANYLWGEDPELGDVVATIRRGGGHANNADDLGSLAALFTEHWDKAEGQCGVSLDDIAEAEELGAKILQAMSPSRAELFDDVRGLRRRAAEHLRRGIEQVRAAAMYLFRDTPAEMERYPSLFVRRKKKNGHSKAGGAEAIENVSTSTPESNMALGEPSPEGPLPPHDDEPLVAHG